MKASRYIACEEALPGRSGGGARALFPTAVLPGSPGRACSQAIPGIIMLFVTMCKVVLLILRYIRGFLVCKYKKKKKKAWKHTASTVLTSTLEMTARLSAVHFQVVSWRRSLPMHAIAPTARVNLNITAFCMNDDSSLAAPPSHSLSVDLSLLPKVVNYTPQLTARGKRSWAYALHRIPVRVKEFYFASWGDKVLFTRFWPG